MRRREFISLLGGLASIPLTAHAQQAAMPLVGYLSSNLPEDGEPRAAAFRRGLQEAGYVVGQNVAIEYHWAEQQIDRLPAMAADLVKRRVTVIAAVTTPAALVAQTATTTIPIVFEMGSDPVRLGLVTNLNRPGGNVTGVTSLIVEVAPKRLELRDCPHRRQRLQRASRKQLRYCSAARSATTGEWCFRQRWLQGNRAHRPVAFLARDTERHEDRAEQV